MPEKVHPCLPTKPSNISSRTTAYQYSLFRPELCLSAPTKHESKVRSKYLSELGCFVSVDRSKSYLSASKHFLGQHLHSAADIGWGYQHNLLPTALSQDSGQGSSDKWQTGPRTAKHHSAVILLFEQCTESLQLEAKLPIEHPTYIS